jgi:REP element-mobilizing transposase RayT
MARQWRIEYPGALYHVLSRGNGGQDIFHTDKDRHLFLSLLEELADRFQIRLNAYVLMDNHYHLLLKTGEANLSRAMQWFGTTYTRRFNIANHMSGHLFQGRFKSILVQNDTYLMRLSCYIHRNPLRAGIINRLADYQWSSYRYYAYKKKAPGWLETDQILDQLTGSDRQKAYRVKVQKYSDEKASIFEDVKHGLIIGSQEFVADIKARFLGDSKDAELPQHNRLFREFDPKLILAKASKVLDFDLEAARNKPKISPDEKDHRDLLIYLLWQAGRLSNSEIGVYFGLTYSAVSRRVKIISDKILSDYDLRADYEILKSQIKV